MPRPNAHSASARFASTASDASPGVADVLAGDAKIKDATHDGIVPIPAVAKDGCGRGMPVMQTQDIRWAVLDSRRLQRGPAEQPEPPGVVRVITGRIAVELGTVEGRRMVDQPKAVAASS